MITVTRPSSKTDISPVIFKITNLKGRITFAYMFGNVDYLDSAEELNLENKILIKFAIPIPSTIDMEALTELIRARRPNTISKGKIVIENIRDRETFKISPHLIGLIIITKPYAIAKVLYSFVNKAIHYLIEADTLHGKGILEVISERDDANEAPDNFNRNENKEYVLDLNSGEQNEPADE